MVELRIIQKCIGRKRNQAVGVKMVPLQDGKNLISRNIAHHSGGGENGGKGCEEKGVRVI
jgi:hypothetical protein